MTDDKFRLAQDIQRFLRMFGGLAKISEKLIDVGMLEQQEAEVRTRLVKLGNAGAMLAAARDKADAIIADAQAKTDEILAKAESAAKELLAKTHAQAREVQEKAKAVCDEYESKAEHAAHAAASAAAEHKAELAKLQATMDERARHEQAIAAIKARFA